MDKKTAEGSMSTSDRMTRPVPERTQANREFVGVWRQREPTSAYKIDDELMSKGKATAKQRAPEDIAAEAVDNGYDMIDEFLNQPDAFGIPETGQNNLQGGGIEQILAALAGGGGIPSNIAGMYSQYLDMWNGVFAKFLETVGDPSISGFEEITGMSPTGARRDAGFVILANRELDVDVHWKADVPGERLSIASLQRLDEPSEVLPKGLTVKIRLSVDGKHQVFDVKVPNAVKAGRFTGIIVNPAGVDEGYLTIQLPE